MSEESYIPQSLTEAELKKLLLEAISKAPGPQDLESYHALYDHPERGLTTDDTIHAIEGEWHFGRNPKFNHDEWQWKYWIEGQSVDGEAIVLIIAVDIRNRTFVIVTRWRDDDDP